VSDALLQAKQALDLVRHGLILVLHLDRCGDRLISCALVFLRDLMGDLGPRLT
jgi:hypothetical protein